MNLNLDSYDDIMSGKIKLPEWMKPMMCTIPECGKGDWSIKKMEVEMDFSNLRMMRDGRGCLPGIYTKLVHNKRGIVMSDTNAELWDCYPFLRIAKGSVLIHGLGLGCLVKGLLSKDEITNIDVVEIDQNVIDLVSPHFNDSRLHIHYGNCLDYKWERGKKWDYIWHDIWDNICEDNLDEMKKLHRKFGRRCKFQMSWGRNYLE